MSDARASTTLPPCSLSVLSAFGLGISNSVAMRSTSVFSIGTLASSRSRAAFSAVCAACRLPIFWERCIIFLFNWKIRFQFVLSAGNKPQFSFQGGARFDEFGRLHYCNTPKIRFSKTLTDSQIVQCFSVLGQARDNMISDRTDRCVMAYLAQFKTQLKH